MNRVTRLAESTFHLGEKLDRVIRVQDEHTDKLDAHSAKLDAHSAKLDEHSVKLDRLQAVQDEHSTKLDRLQAGQDLLMQNQLELKAMMGTVLSELRGQRR